ncbi:MAG: cyclase family protein [Gammaproteobacteria bacterium]
MNARALKIILPVLALVLHANVVADSSYEREQWWPSKYGAEDQLGALNLLTSAKILEASRLITEGKVYDLSQVFEEDMPLFALTPQRRKYTLTVPGAPSWGPLGENKLVWNEDHISGHLSQDGTQFDSLSHMGTQLGETGDLNNVRYYNGHTHASIGTGRGFKKLGMEHVTPIFTRGIFLDIAKLKGRALQCSEEISVDDLLAALQQQGLSATSIRPGDALLYHTGWGQYWKTDNNKFNQCAPGLSDEAGDWVVAKNVLLVGTDNWAVEAIPGPDPKRFAPNHQKFLVENGIYIIENMRFDDLIEAEVYEFAFSVAPLALKGATGSPIRPFAIR